MTPAESTVDMTVDVLVEKFEAAKGKWQVHNDFPPLYEIEG